jgi:hypothetical protein
VVLVDSLQEEDLFASHADVVAAPSTAEAFCVD